MIYQVDNSFKPYLGAKRDFIHLIDHLEQKIEAQTTIFRRLVNHAKVVRLIGSRNHVKILEKRCHRWPIKLHCMATLV